MLRAERGAVVDERLARTNRRPANGGALRRLPGSGRLKDPREGVCSIEMQRARTGLREPARPGDDAAKVQRTGGGAGGEGRGAVDRERRRSRGDGEVVGDSDGCGRSRGDAAGAERNRRAGDRERAGSADRNAAHLDRQADGDRRCRRR